MQAVTADDGFRRAGLMFFFKRFMGVGSLRLTKERFFAGAVGGVLVRKILDVLEGSVKLTMAEPLPNYESLPIGPIVVPFWDYLVEFNSKCEAPKGTTMGPMSKV